MNIKIVKLENLEQVWEEEGGLIPIGIASKMLDQNPSNIVRILYKFGTRRYYIESENTNPLLSYRDCIFMKNNMKKLNK